MNDLAAQDNHVIWQWVWRRRWGFMIAILLWAGLAFNGQWLVGPDTADHALIGVELAEGNGFSHPLNENKSVKFQPGLAYVFAANFYLVGKDSFWPALLFMFICGMICLGLIYVLFRFHLPREIAFGLTLICAITENIFKWQYEILRETPFLLGLLLAVIGWQWLAQLLSHSEAKQIKRICIAAVLLCTGLLWMWLFRTVVISVIFAMLLTLGVSAMQWVAKAEDKMKRVGAVLVMSLGLVSMLLLARVVLMGEFSLNADERIVYMQVVDAVQSLRHAELPPLLTKIFSHMIHKLPEALAEACFAVDFGTWLNIPLGLLALMSCIFLFRQKHMLWGMLFLVFAIQQLPFHVNDRYCMTVTPFMVFAWWQLTRWLANKQMKQECVLIIFMLVLWCVPSLIMSGKMIYRQRQTPFYQHYKDGQMRLPRELAPLLKAVPDNAVIGMNEYPKDKRFNVIRPYLSFLSDRKVLKVRIALKSSKDQELIYFLYRKDDPALNKMLLRKQMIRVQAIGEYSDHMNNEWLLFSARRK